VRPHDMLRLARGPELRYEGSVPAWVPESLARAPWVVVRRAPMQAGLIPVGVRGRARGERFAAWLAPDAVAAHVTPEYLAAARCWSHVPRARRVGCLRVLDAVDELCTSLGLAWGPTGSVGFELATGVPSAGVASDLDVVIRAPQPWSLEKAREMADYLNRLPARVDAQLEVPAGAVALDEYARGGQVLLRAPDGRGLTRDPWREAPIELQSA
jgi:phosphoribosyl-dephospho-CoA transferase